MSNEKENRAILNDITKANCQLIDNRTVKELIDYKDATIKKLKVNMFYLQGKIFYLLEFSV
jgi:hypothetical protein